MKIINNNPYRQLGVYSTSTQKEVVANQGKMKAFLKVGRQVSFPLDLMDSYQMYCAQNKVLQTQYQNCLFQQSN